MFPRQNALLGESVYWTIEIRYPVWESYRLSINQLDGMEITLADSKLHEQDRNITATYLVKIVPQSLDVSGTPSVLIYDDRGQSSALNGKRIEVKAVSGQSLEIQPPAQLQFRKVENRFPYWHSGAILILLLTFVFLRIRRNRAAAPKQVLLRQLRRISGEIKQNRFKNPPVLSRLLRSELIWGMPGDAMTASELKTKADQDLHRSAIADALQVLDQARFSGDTNLMDPELSQKALSAAVGILAGKQQEFAASNTASDVPKEGPGLQ